MGKLGDMNKLRQQAMQMQKNLAAQTITVEENGVKVVITGDQKIISIEIQGLSNEVLNDVINKAIRKSQELAAKELMNVSGGMGGLMGNQTCRLHMECKIPFCTDCLANQYLLEADALNAANKKAALMWILQGKCTRAEEMLNRLGGKEKVEELASEYTKKAASEINWEQ